MSDTPTTEKLQQQIEDLQSQLEIMTNTAKRTMADLQNLQKRTQIERLQLYPQAQADLMIEFLPVIDNFQRAFENIPESLKTDNWVQGMTQIEKQFTDILNKTGLEEIVPDTDFNPNEHEALVEVEGEKNQVIQVFEKGYRFKDKVIRAAKVSVGNSPAGPSDELR
ncbi:nucleotide exchange factor GrpE [Candidatus Peregrinibacteria bacterium CG_4_9_14_0_2_um_filter_41_14]|nr:MAG: nucleotide exchange factor GrpE [Candidatus Peregrinibacteria bacterium CG_4_9_14_0_2_um_filter_41_14]